MNVHTSYPFDRSIVSHLYLALGIALWTTIFLFFTEPLDVSQLDNHEKLMYLPLYGLGGALAYVLILPIQYYLSKKSDIKWSVTNEVIFLLSLIFICAVVSRLIYLSIVMRGEPNPYTLGYYLKTIYIPAILTILPLIIIGRYVIGRIYDKKLRSSKIEIKGDGAYEGLRLFIEDLISVHASDNYVEVNYLESGELKKKLIRTKLSTVESNHNALLRTHRSHLINPYHFKSWISSSGKRSIQLSGGVIVPLSKTFADHVKALLNPTT